MSEWHAQTWQHYPMAPNVRRYLGLDDADASTLPRASEQMMADFHKFLQFHIAEQPVPDSKSLLDLMEEFTAMGFADISVKLCDLNAHLFPADDASAQAALGNAALLAGDHARAEVALRDAQELAPDLANVYLNLAQLYFLDERDASALEWCLAGLDVEPNHLKLWDLLARIYQIENPETFPERIRAAADHRISWAGHSLAGDLLDSHPRLKMELLEPYFASGEQSPEFLIEWTGALGKAEVYGQIPAIVLQAEALQAKKLPWQLYAHAGQALLAMERKELAVIEFQKALAAPDITPLASGELAALIRSLNDPEQQATHAH